MVKKVLIVDDECDFVDAVTEFLEAHGFKVLRAYNGVEGLERAHAEKPDIIVLDIAMPEMDGYEVCRKLKIDEKFNGIPIIMLTAKFQPNDIEFAKEIGADAYLTKPLELSLLLNKIKEFLKKE